MVMYDYDGNAIMAEPINISQEETIHDAFLNIHKLLK